MRIHQLGPTPGGVADRSEGVRANRRSVAAGFLLVALLVVPLGALALSPSGTPHAAASDVRSGAGLKASASSASSIPAASTPGPHPGNWVPLPASSSPQPPARTSAALSFDAATGQVLLFGGCTQYACPAGDTWVFSAGQWSNLTASQSVSPPARMAASLTYLPGDRAVLLFGGTGSRGALSDTWEFLGGRWTQIPSSLALSPSARSSAGLTYDPVTASALLFGGADGAGHALSDLWAFSQQRWVNVTPGGSPLPAARSGAAFVYDVNDGYVLLFGGTGRCGQPCSDTWTYTTSGWTNRTGSLTTAPAARSAPGVAFDTGNGEVMLFGGQSVIGLSDTWGFFQGTWHNLSALGARPVPAQWSPGVAFDGTDGYLVAFGGALGSGAGSGTWVFVTMLKAVLLPTSSSIGPHVMIGLSSLVIGGLPPYKLQITTGDGSPPTNASAATHAYALPGVYRAQLSATDQRGLTATNAVWIHVASTALAASITATPSTVALGAPTVLAVSTTGGLPPYSYGWAGLPSGCPPADQPTVQCTPTVAGTFVLTVTITDSGGRTVQPITTLSVVHAAPSRTSGPTGPAASSALTPLGWVLVAPLAVGMALSAAGAVLMLLASRRVRNMPPPPDRPFCYVPPEWSETPDESKH